MYSLHLRLSNQVEGRFIASGRPFPGSRFAINAAFTILEVLADGEPVPYQTMLSGDGYQTVAFDAPECRTLAVAYAGILDGTTGRYPYVREKTTDAVYLLRSETVYYPVFAMPDSAEYFREMLAPLARDLFRVTVELSGTRTFQTNLREISPGVYEGHNPTIAVGGYQVERCSFGSVAYLSMGPEDLEEIRRTVERVNLFMGRYKAAEIRDLQIVEIPEGYGSFVLPGTLFVAGRADCRHLTHECVHTHWNPRCSGAIQRARFFDEGITEYFTAKILSHFGLQTEESSRAAWAAEYRTAIARDPALEAPIVEYGARELGGLSYSFGPLALFALEDAIGAEEMEAAMASLLAQYQEEEIDFQKFRSLFPPCAEAVFQAYFDSTEASRRILCSV